MKSPKKLLNTIDQIGISELPTLYIDHINVGGYLLNTLAADRNHNREEALVDIYRALRPGSPYY